MRYIMLCSLLALFGEVEFEPLGILPKTPLTECAKCAGKECAKSAKMQETPKSDGKTLREKKHEIVTELRAERRERRREKMRELRARIREREENPPRRVRHRRDRQDVPAAGQRE
jgi:hypothetical protein